jgi:hypothetical protein
MFGTAAQALELQRDEAREVRPFSFTIEYTSGDVTLACDSGCAWKSLGFTMRRDQILIDENGMVDDRNNRHGGKSGFLIGIGSSDDRIELSCKSGCAWKTLSYSPKSAVRKIDEFGMGPK